jgi:4-hydroxy-tetrahydrodipicolinate reductase
MAIRVMISGAKGRMGQVAVQTLAAMPAFLLVAEINRSDSLAARIKQDQPDIVLDFTSPEVVYQNTEIILAHAVRPIIGTTGLTTAQVEHLQSLAQRQNVGGIIAPNFSLGALLMMRCAKIAAAYFSHAEIIEMHHEQKKDKPSGTAQLTAEMINEVGLRSPVTKTVPGTGMPYGAVTIHSLRMPGVIANQQVIFAGSGETLTFDHRVQDRTVFAAGIQLACEKVMTLNRLIYGLEQLLD